MVMVMVTMLGLMVLSFMRIIAMAMLMLWPSDDDDDDDDDDNDDDDEDDDDGGDLDASLNKVDSCTNFGPIFWYCRLSHPERMYLSIKPRM